MSAVAVLGLGQISACGCGIGALGEALLAGPPTPEWLATSPGGASQSFPVMRARRQGLENLVPPRALRRLDRFTSDFVLAARLALDDAQVDLPDPGRIGVVMGSGHGSMTTSFAQLDEIIDEGDGASSPFKFTTAVNNAPASSVSAVLGARGPCLALAGSSALVANVLLLAADLLDSGAADLVLAGAGDEVHPVMGYGLQLGSGWSADGRIRPLQPGSSSFVPGEVTASMVLARPETVARDRPRIEAIHVVSDLCADYVPPPGRHLIVAADGRPETDAVLRTVATRAHSVAAFAGLWGGGPSSPALDLMVACLELRNGLHFRVPGTHPDLPGLTLPRTGQPLGSRVIDCVAAHPGGGGSVITLHG